MPGPESRNYIQAGPPRGDDDNCDGNRDDDDVFDCIPSDASPRDNTGRYPPATALQGSSSPELALQTLGVMSHTSSFDKALADQCAIWKE